ncbi:SixA phosphatase family protein [Chitinibacter sp. S2-10]|uniref:SixA phosphatase family protein n=1 Tax=Chitinibacter sp. S2-10 TaxID=3373597 RepID=UPI003977262D
MDLILWRHAEAEDRAANDLARALTGKGCKQAAQMAKCLRAQLAGREVCVFASQAIRSQQTAAALGWPVMIDARLNPDQACAQSLLDVAQEVVQQAAGKVVILVGHQPILGGVASLLLCGVERSLNLKKAAVCWLQCRDGQADLRAMLTPELLAKMEK